MTEIESESDGREAAIYKIFFDSDGFCTYPDGTRYKGGLHDGVPHGEGLIYYTDGSSYKGEWDQGNSHG